MNIFRQATGNVRMTDPLTKTSTVTPRPRRNRMSCRYWQAEQMVLNNNCPSKLQPPSLTFSPAYNTFNKFNFALGSTTTFNSFSFTLDIYPIVFLLISTDAGWNRHSLATTSKYVCVLNSISISSPHQITFDVMHHVRCDCEPDLFSPACVSIVAMIFLSHFFLLIVPCASLSLMPGHFLFDYVSPLWHMRRPHISCCENLMLHADRLYV